MSGTGGVDLVIFADNHQFCVSDVRGHSAWIRRGRPADPEQAFGWTEEAVQCHRIAVEPHLIAVGTARADWVDVTIREHGPGPTAAPSDAVHVVEADLNAPSGELSVFGPAAGRGAEHRLTVAGGGYRVRVSYVPADPPKSGFDEDEPGDHFRYVVDLWPSAAPAGLVVLRQGPVPWAG